MKGLFLLHFSPGLFQTASRSGGGGSLSAPGQHEQEHPSAERWHKGSAYVRARAREERTRHVAWQARHDACFTSVCALQVSLTAFPERLEAQYGGVPWWIIVLSVLLGLLLLGLLAFLLWKVGHTQTQTHTLSRSTFDCDFCQTSLSKRTQFTAWWTENRDCRYFLTVCLSSSVDYLGKRIKRTCLKKRDWHQMHKKARVKFTDTEWVECFLFTASGY